MSTDVDDSLTTREGAIEIELEYLFDDTGNPSEVTVFAPSGRRKATEWITAPTAVAVPFEEMQ